MRRVVLIIGSIFMVLVLVACGSTPAEVVDQVSAGGDPVEQSTVGGETEGQLPERELPLATLLMLGTFKLEDTDSPVTPAQAAELLPLWKALRSLDESETTAVEELEAVVNQIEGIMTSEQMAAIEAMQLSFEDMRTIGEELGIELGGFGRFGDLTPEMQATMEAARESGQLPGGDGFPGGGPGMGMGPGGGGGLGGGEGLDPEARQTAIAERGGVRGANLGLNSQLLDAMIELLQARVQ